MINSDLHRLLDNELKIVSLDLGIQISSNWNELDHNFDFSMRMIPTPKPNGFRILAAEDLLNWRFKVQMDEFSIPALQVFKENFYSNYEEFLNFFQMIADKHRTSILKVNGVSIFELKEENLWNDFLLEISQNFEQLENSMEIFRNCIVDILTIMLTLLKAPNSNMDPSEFKMEGEISYSNCRKYERNRLNRQICLNHFGYRCRICNILLSEIYGSAGINVIHVHHIEPVSQMQKPRILDPRIDLIPICPNCHNVAHRKSPPYTPDEIRKFLDKGFSNA